MLMFSSILLLEFDTCICTVHFVSVYLIQLLCVTTGIACTYLIVIVEFVDELIIVVTV